MTKFYLYADRYVAVDSPDHLYPTGAINDNSINLKFNKTIKDLGVKSVLDFGCAGGGMVKTLLDDGILAVGLEGSDRNKESGRHEWDVIPDNLFTVDIGFPFTLTNGSGRPYQFDVITMWEFIEHIPEKRINQVIRNAVDHLKTNGMIIGSTTDSQHVKADERYYHQTAKHISWWYEKFGKFGLVRDNEKESYFAKRSAWVRQVKWNFVLEKIDGDN